ncbi:hypothetical protein QOZ80_8BG0664970 [Eleusine coracana subsp. coracana]|nr:hypothetical protein QOZ80_8BG0664970 [Eleusine coracana subsp. coracana]
MVSDQELAHYVESLVRQTASRGGSAISADAVMRQLEAQLRVDLTPKTQLIRDILVALLGPSQSPEHPSRKDPFEAAAGASAGPAAPSHPHFAAAAASASAPPPAMPHFFPQQMPSFFSAAPQFQHQQHRPAEPASPYDIPASHRYTPQISDARRAGLAYFQQMQEEARHYTQVIDQRRQQQEQQHPAATAAAVAVTTPAESPRAPATPAVSKKDSATTGVKRRAGSGGLNKVCGVSPELQAIVGEPTMARTEIVKQLWAYIRRNNLQDPNNKRKIICNDELRLVFETDSTDMFKMNKLLAKHIHPLEPTKDSKRDAKKLKPAEDEPVSTIQTDPNQLPITMSDALASFLGTEEREMPQSEAVKRVWDHIKSNNLEDPANPAVILCDSKLKQLFGCESLSAVGVSELLSQHLFKQPTKV